MAAAPDAAILSGPAGSRRRPIAAASVPAAAGSPTGVADDAYIHEAVWFESTPFCSQDQPPDLPTLRTDVLELATHTRPFVVSSSKAIGQLFDNFSASSHQLQMLRDDMQATANSMSQEVMAIKNEVVNDKAIIES